MPDADEMLRKVAPNYPLSNFLTLFGVFLVLALEQSIIIIRHYFLSHEKCDECSEEDSNYSPYQNQDALQEIQPIFSHDSSKQSSKKHYPDHCEDPSAHSASFHDVLIAHNFREVISAYVLEISTAVHSMVIGFDLGILTETDLNTISILFAALIFHQFVEGLGLGAVMKTTERQLGSKRVMSFVFLFSSTVSLGVILGIICQPSSSSSSSSLSTVSSSFQCFLKGSFTAMAAGSLLYISFVEMIGEYFHKPELEKNGGMKIGMLILFFVGMGVMSLIGLWM
jgi:zinc transporter ZupT